VPLYELPPRAAPRLSIAGNITQNFTFVVGLGFALTAYDPARRAWWFGFSVVAGLCLPLCPLVEQSLHSIALFLQGLSQKGTISLSQRVIEPTLVLMVVLCPFLAVGLLGVVAGRFTRQIAGHTRPSETSDSIIRARWRLSIRELLIGIAARPRKVEISRKPKNRSLQPTGILIDSSGAWPARTGRRRL
jgi:nucleoside diphosphate kinase